MSHKIYASPYVFINFKSIIQSLNDYYKDFIERPEIAEYIKTHPELNNDLIETTKKYIRKVNSICDDWFLDWKNYGELETLFPRLLNFDSMTEAERQSLVDEIRKILSKMYTLCTTEKIKATDNNHPLKNWISENAGSKLRNYMEAIHNPSLNMATIGIYNKQTIQSKLGEFEDRANNIMKGSILQTFSLIKEHLDYIKPFAKINYLWPNQKPASFKTLLAGMTIKPGYTFSQEIVRAPLLRIYKALKERLGYMGNLYTYATDWLGQQYITIKPGKFVDCLLHLNGKYFENFKEKPIECLYQIYIIQQNGEENALAWNIENITAIMEMNYKEMKKAIENIGSFTKWFIEVFAPYLKTNEGAPSRSLADQLAWYDYT